MASDRSPLSRRLRAIAQRAGRPGADDQDAAAPEPPRPTSPALVPPPAPVAQETPDDEQPTGDVPLIPEPHADDQPTIASPAVETPLEHGERPPLAPPVVPARAVDPGLADETPAPSGDDSVPSEPEAHAEDDEPFAPNTTIWPQRTPEPPTFPPASPTPESGDADPGATEPSAPEPGASADEPLAAAPTETASTDTEPAPTGRAVEVEPTDDTTEQPAVPPSGGGRARAFSRLRALRGGTSGAAVPTETPAADGTPPLVAAAPTPEATVPTPPAPEPEPDPAPAPAPLPPAALEPPAKPSFTERAALRRRAKSLRARRDSGLLELGAIVLDQRRFGDPTGGSLVRRRTDELADIDSELAAIEQVLDDDGPAETVAQLRVVRCLTCTALVGPTDRFCVQCGAPRPEDVGRPPAAS